MGKADVALTWNTLSGAHSGAVHCGAGVSHCRDEPMQGSPASFRLQGSITPQT